MHHSDLIAFPTNCGTSALPCGSTGQSGCSAKARRETRPLTLGGCIAGVCEAYGPDCAEGFLRFAVNAGIVVFPGHRVVEIAPRDTRTEGRPNQHQATGLLRYFLPDGRDQRPATPRSRYFRVSSEARLVAAPIWSRAADDSHGWMQPLHTKTG